MKGGVWISCLWASFVIVAGIGLGIWSGDVLLGLLLAGGGIPALAIAAIYQWRPAITTRRLPQTGMPVLVIAIGLVATAVGLSAGIWLLLIGGQIILVGLLLLARELLAERGTDR